MSKSPAIRNQEPGTRNQEPASGTHFLLARRLTLPGWLRKVLSVPEQHTALVLAKSGPYTLGPGRHTLANWPVPAPDVMLIETGSLPLELQIEALPTGDDETAALVAELEVTVADPLRLNDMWLRLSPGPEWLLPADAVAGRLYEMAAEQVGRYESGDLRRPVVRENIARELRPSLETQLARYGLRMATPSLSVRVVTLADRQAAAQAARAAREMARDARMTEALARLDSRDMFLDRIASWQARTGETLDKGTVELLWKQIAPGGLPLSEPGEVQQALDEGAAALETTAKAEQLSPERRLTQMLTRLDAPAQPQPDSPSRQLNQLYHVLRLGVAGLGAGWALYGAASNGFQGSNVMDVLLEGLGLLVAMVGMGAALLTYRRAVNQANPYWQHIQDQIAHLPASAALARARERRRRLYLIADGLILLGLVLGLLLWLGERGHIQLTFLSALPGMALNEQNRILFTIPVVLFVVAFILVLTAHAGERHAQQQAEALLGQTAGSGPALRHTADDLVRRQVREYLDRVKTNLEETGRRLFRLGPAGQNLSVDLRQLRMGPLAACQAETQTVHERDARYFATALVPPVQLARMLDLDEELLHRSRQLALASEALYAAGVDGDPSRCVPAIAELDKNLNQLRRVLGERAAFIGS